MKNFNCLKCGTEVVVDETMSRQRRKFCSRECCQTHHNESIMKPKEKLFGKIYIQRVLLKTHKSIDDIILELGIQPTLLNEGYISDKKHNRFNQEQVDMIVEKFKQNQQQPKINTVKTFNKLKINFTNIAKNLDITWHTANKIANEHFFNIKQYTNFDHCLADFKILFDKYEENKKTLDNFCDYKYVAKILNLESKNQKKLRTMVSYYFNRYGTPNGEVVKRVDNVYKKMWPIQEIETWSANIVQLKEQRQEKMQNNALKEQKEQERKEFLKNELEGYINQKEALKFLNRSHYNTADRIESFSKKIGERLYYKKIDIEQFKDVLKQEKIEKQKQSRDNKNAKIIRVNYNWTDDLNYDNTKWRQIQTLGMPSNLTDQRDVEKWHNNIQIMEDRIQRNIIKTLTCRKCKQVMPYYSFNMDIKGGNAFGRYQQCRICTRTKRYKSPTGIKIKKNASKFLCQFIIAIKQDISKRNKSYYNFTSKEMWNNIQKNLGYSKQDLINHIESQFLDWMNWENNGRPISTNEPTWNLDHVKPRSKFNYTSMDEPEFVECWSLANLKPIEAVMNLIKSDKDFMQRCARSFRKGLIDLDADSFIWKKLSYSPADARAELEKKYNDKIEWDKFSNSNLHIDHIVPQAYLSFSSFDDENFLKCWDINNLQIMINKDNSSKGSLFEGKIWFYNKE